MKRNERQLFEDVRNATHFSRQHLSDWLDRAKRAEVDLDHRKRHDAQLCRWCYYARGTRVAGQAFTTRACDFCGEDQSYPTTATNRACNPCAKKYGICVYCVADLGLIDRKKLERSR